VWGAKTGRRSLEGISAAFSFDRTVFVTDEEGEALAREYFADFPRSPYLSFELVLFDGDGCRPLLEYKTGRAAGFATSAWNLYFGLMTITESMEPFPSSSVAEFAGSFSPTPSTRNL
jgi:hypothetical protein